MELSLGQLVKIDGDKENNTYAVRGYDPVSKRYWLANDDETYEGNDGDLLVVHTHGNQFQVVLADSRTAHGNQINLVTV